MNIFDKLQGIKESSINSEVKYKRHLQKLQFKKYIRDYKRLITLYKKANKKKIISKDRYIKNIKSITDANIEAKISFKKFNKSKNRLFDGALQDIELRNKNLGVFNRFMLHERIYKFSKSNKDIKNLFAEKHYYDYNNNEIAYDSGRTLSVADNLNLLLNCAKYGDQITIFTNNPPTKYIDKLFNANIKSIDNAFGEWLSDYLIIEGNISISDPYILKDLLIISDEINCYDFLGGSFDYIDLYSKLHFTKTLDFYKKVQKLYNENIFSYEELDKILPEEKRIKGNNKSKEIINYIAKRARKEKSLAAKIRINISDNDILKTV